MTPTVFSIDELHTKATKMQAFLEKRFDTSEPNELIRRMEELGIMISQSGKMLADAKYYKDKIVNGAIMESIQKAYQEKLSTTTINKFVETAAREYSFLVNWIDEINSCAGKQHAGIITLISYRKAEMQMV